MCYTIYLVSLHYIRNSVTSASFKYVNLVLDVAHSMCEVSKINLVSEYWTLTNTANRDDLARMIFLRKARYRHKMFILYNCLMSGLVLKNPITWKLMVRWKQIQYAEGQRTWNWALCNERADLRSRAFQCRCKKHM